MKQFAIAVVASLMSAATVQAAITDVDFTGRGVVTSNMSGFDGDGDPYTFNIAVGDPVRVAGFLHFGSDAYGNAPPPDRFTGTFVFDDYALHIGTQAFDFVIDGPPGKASGGGCSARQCAPIFGGDATFDRGRLVGIDLYNDQDGYYAALSTSSFYVSVGYDQAASFDGRYTLDVAPGGVPEPASWAMMVVGFGLVGSIARRRLPAARTTAVAV